MCTLECFTSPLSREWPQVVQRILEISQCRPGCRRACPTCGLRQSSSVPWKGPLASSRNWLELLAGEDLVSSITVSILPRHLIYYTVWHSVTSCATDFFSFFLLCIVTGFKCIKVYLFWGFSFCCLSCFAFLFVFFSFFLSSSSFNRCNSARYSASVTIFVFRCTFHRFTAGLSVGPLIMSSTSSSKLLLDCLDIPPTSVVSMDLVVDSCRPQ